ncbi:hypothetical protein LTS18_004333 [Coniosporium uncinatum]|uniref:Uncharacterized protein n=1 Tax=Coniosporium uncinatum TaxID=93489 RepID=A0ACC3DBN0_9PEZI|nr:hypothetical protein LTS18_004333 [Coniosporium uncinatum]
MTTYTTVVAEIAATSYGFAGYFTAAPIIVRFQEGEIPTATTSDASESAAIGDRATNSTSSISLSQSESAGTSTGAKAGIGVGISLGFLALVAVGYLPYRRYRRQATATGGSVQDWSTPELSDRTKEAKELTDDSAVARELPGSPPAKLEGHGQTRIDET